VPETNVLNLEVGGSRTSRPIYETRPRNEMMAFMIGPLRIIAWRTSWSLTGSIDVPRLEGSPFARSWEEVLKGLWQKIDVYGV
jgi:hypothetical protein